MKSFQLMQPLPGDFYLNVFTKRDDGWYNETHCAYVANKWLKEILNNYAGAAKFNDWFREVPSEKC